MIVANLLTSANLKLGHSIAYLVQSALYAHLPKEEHEGFKAKNGRVYKRFCFDTHYDAKNGTVGLRFSSLHADHEQAVARAILTGEFRIGEVVVNRSDVAMENPRIDGGRMIRFGHIAAKIQDEKGNAVWLHPESSRFFQNVTANAIERYETLTGESYAGGLEIKPLRTNRKKIHHYQKNRIEVWGAEYEITGERKMLEFLDRTGIGANLAQGLGLLRGVKHG